MSDLLSLNEIIGLLPEEEYKKLNVKFVDWIYEINNKYREDFDVKEDDSIMHFESAEGVKKFANKAIEWWFDHSLINLESDNVDILEFLKQRYCRAQVLSLKNKLEKEGINIDENDD